VDRKQYIQEKLQRLEDKFVKFKDLLSVQNSDGDTDKEGFYVIPNTGFGVIGRFQAIRDMENDTHNIIVRETVYKKLCDADNALKRKAGYETCQIVVTYGYRRPEIQQNLFEDKMNQKKEEYPTRSELDLIEMVHREIAHPSVAGHPTGGAVDVTIYDYKKEKYLEFGTELYDFSSKNIYYDSDDITKEQKKNRKILRSVMCQQEFAPFDGEWWHFCYGDKEWAFYKARRSKYSKENDSDQYKALYQQKKYEEISQIIYNDKFKTHVQDNQLRVRLAMQKDGRLTEETLAILKKSGIEITPDKRGFLTKSNNFPLEVLFVRDDDISKLVDAGVADIGIVGENVYRENDSKSIIKRYLGFGKCFLALAIPKNSNIKTLHDLNGKKIATSYHRLTKEFLDQKGIEVKAIIDIAGSVEIAPEIEYADAIVDLVSTGGSLQQNNLEVFFNIMNSQSILIENPEAITNEKKERIISQLIQRIDCYLVSKKYKRVTMMVPDEQLDYVGQVITKVNKADNMDDDPDEENALEKDNGINKDINRNDTIIDMRAPVSTPIHGCNGKWHMLQTIMKLSELWEKTEELQSHGVRNIVFFDIEGIIN
jgi:ATP phosphoribosyltransferase